MFSQKQGTCKVFPDNIEARTGDEITQKGEKSEQRATPGYIGLHLATPGQMAFWALKLLGTFSRRIRTSRRFWEKFGALPVQRIGYTCPKLHHYKLQNVSCPHLEDFHGRLAQYEGIVE
ncbi:hypothetical protein RRG08_061249 [Elysia crispata]|uniref:Uncharacterized protein n=1 Tax=Elysia crispata TaxID=231223 RepID=A0AAE0ZGJ7_9GAST|nr:hypothetical protein RRG08_061249 [Elysia crispata]